MAPFKVLILAIVGTISLNNKDCNHHQNNGQIVFYNITDTVTLEKNEYLMKVNSVGFDLSMLEEIKLKRINNMKSPQVSFSIGGTRFIAVGMDMLSSSLPKNAEYFFPLNKEKKAWLNGKVLQFNKINR
jgi:hypothetical protein